MFDGAGIQFVPGVTTVKVVVPEMAPCCALMVELPALTPVARPPETMVATVLVTELHVTCELMFCVEASE